MDKKIGSSIKNPEFKRDENSYTEAQDKPSEGQVPNSQVKLSLPTVVKIYIEGEEQKSLDKTIKDRELNKSKTVATLSTVPTQAKTDVAKKNKAATIIQRAYRKRLASESYRYMISNGRRFKLLAKKDGGKYSHFRKYHEDNQQKVSDADVLPDIQKFSSLCLQETKDTLGELTPREKAFIRKLNSYNMVFIHSSLKVLVDIRSKKFTIYSNKTLKDKAISVRMESTYDDDRKEISNHDFVFFRPLFLGDSDNLDNLLPLHTQYGDHYYITDETKGEFGFITMTDQKINKLDPNWLKYSQLWDKFPGILSPATRQISGKDHDYELDLIDVHMYTAKAMKSAIAYHFLNFLHILDATNLSGVEDSIQESNKEFIDYVLDDARTPDEMSYLLLALFKAEFHIPRVVSEIKPLKKDRYRLEGKKQTRLNVVQSHILEKAPQRVKNFVRVYKSKYKKK